MYTGNSVFKFKWQKLDSTGSQPSASHTNEQHATHRIYRHRNHIILKLQWEKHQEELKVSGFSTEIADSASTKGEIRKRRRKHVKIGSKEVRGIYKPSVPLAILMSSAVRIKAMRVELKWTVLSSATGRSIRSNLCGRANQGERWENRVVSGVVCMWNLQVMGKGHWVGGRKGRGSGEKGGVRVKEVEGAVHSIWSRLCLPVTNGSDSATVSN